MKCLCPVLSRSVWCHNLSNIQLCYMYIPVLSSMDMLWLSDKSSSERIDESVVKAIVIKFRMADFFFENVLDLDEFVTSWKSAILLITSITNFGSQHGDVPYETFIWGANGQQQRFWVQIEYFGDLGRKHRKSWWLLCFIA